MGGRKGKRPLGDDDDDATTPPTTPNTPNTVRGTIKRQKREAYKTAAEGHAAMMPKKKWFRQRAHANPFSDHALTYPIGPGEMDWRGHYPAFVDVDVDVDVKSVEEEKERGQEKDEEVRKLKQPVEVADVGCGFGGLLFALAPRLPDTLMLGLEIRTSVTEFVQNKVRALRAQQAALRSGAALQEQRQADSVGAIQARDEMETEGAEEQDDMQQEEGRPDTVLSAQSATPTSPIPGGYANISALRANTMKFLPNFFRAASLSKIFLCFPDPHFKARKHKARIVSNTLVSEYAYVMKEGGRVYCITDVEDLGDWMEGCFRGAGLKSDGTGTPMFGCVIKGVESRVAGTGALEGEVQERVWECREGDAGERWKDQCVEVMLNQTEEGKKVTRNGGNKYVTVWRRMGDPPWPDEVGGEGSGAMDSTPAS